MASHSKELLGPPWPEDVTKMAPHLFPGVARPSPLQGGVYEDARSDSSSCQPHRLRQHRRCRGAERLCPLGEHVPLGKTSAAENTALAQWQWQGCK